MQQIISLLKLIRVHNCLIAAVGVWLGGYLNNGSPFSDDLLLASIAMALICAAGNAMNDFFDVEIDRVNHPARPLPREEIPLYLALQAALILFLFGLVVSLLVNIYVFVIVLGCALLLLIYNLGLKKIAVWGNLIVAVLGGLAFITGGAAVSWETCWNIPGPIVPAVFAILFHLGREWVKDRADLKGDTRAGYCTLPMILSPGSFLFAVAVPFAGLICLTLIPVYYQWYGLAYGIIVVGLVNLPLIITIIYLIFSRREERFKLSGQVMKVLMLFGLLAFFLGNN